MVKFCVGSAQPREESEMEEYLKLASSRNVEVLCFPEGFLGSYKSVEKLLELARDYGIRVVTGYDELHEDEKKFQSAIIVNDHAEIIGKHSKTYLSNSETKDGRTAGDRLEVFSTEFGKIGIVICAEILCPEVTRVLCLKGAEIIFHPIGTGMDSQIQYDGWKGMIKTRAIENLLYFVSSTHNKVSSRGGLGIPLGLIVNPGGIILAEAKKRGLIYTTLDTTKRDEDARKGELSHGSYLKMISIRQPKLYSLIAQALRK